MKKILGIVAGIVGIISVIVGVALKMNNNAIAIIGGADGPTSVFVAGKLNSVPVSYTHLDVYKRQIVFLSASCLLR